VGGVKDPALYLLARLEQPGRIGWERDHQHPEGDARCPGVVGIDP